MKTPPGGIGRRIRQSGFPEFYHGPKPRANEAIETVTTNQSDGGLEHVRQTLKSAEDPFNTLRPAGGDKAPANDRRSPGDDDMGPMGPGETEDEIARSLASQEAGRILFDHRLGRWFEWSGDRWKRDATGGVPRRIRSLLLRAGLGQKPSVKERFGRAATVSGVARQAQSEPSLAISGAEWDSDPFLLACPGGTTVDLRTGESRPSRPKDRITKLAGAAPEDGPCPRWHGFLDHVARGDEDVVAFIQVLMGYLLTGVTSEQVLLFVYGPGGNGKSVLLNILLRLLGDYGAVASMETFATSGRSQHLAFLATLDGARLVTASETEEGRGWAESRIKSLTGGDPITANFMRSDPFTFIPTFKLIFSGNHLPSLRSVDPAIRRRFLVLPVTKIPPRPDPELEEKLWEEAPQILSWAIRGCLQWQEEGLPRPEAVTAASDLYFADMDAFGEWREQCTQPAALTEHATAAALFASWKTYCEANGEKPGTAKGFGQRLRRVGLGSGTERIDGRPAKVWYAIMLRSQ